ncbi:hypothetical protein NP233_g12835 [Leucocoprinus birnbaumii]|uniref:Uncharacterized protein n=1 Tax=Leucocoprinus birnbaumii TaxID=56174 RepID=A0AAD5YPN5_9AGAR|nr:hypothetical protein NP233_g12835 [Leucocoprinus birnbaumii]
MSSERSTSNKYSHLPSGVDPSFSDPTQQAQHQTERGMVEEEDHPPFVSASESSKYNMIPDPKFAREYIGPGPEREMPQTTSTTAETFESTESRQRSTRLQNDPLLGSEKFGIPRESKPTQERR